jgi:hypothetical protein
MKNLELCFGEVLNEDGNRESYCFHHEFEDGGGGSGYGLSLDHLAGYLEGATANRYTHYQLVNGMSPEHCQAHFSNINIAPLNREDLQALLEKSHLDGIYPKLLRD